MGQPGDAGVPFAADVDAADHEAARRIQAVDALRGFALFGILMVNITYVASAYYGTGLEDLRFDSPLDQGARYLVTLLFETKFYLLFSFLFGYSFMLQLASAERGGRRFAPRFLRRLAVLFLIGALHAVVFFPGDILTTYACLGLILLAVYRIGPRRAARAAVVLLVVIAAGYLLLAVVQHSAGGGVDAEIVQARAQQVTEALRGGPASVLATHVSLLSEVLLLLLLFQAPTALAAFLFGLAAGGRAALANLSERGRTLCRLQQIGFPVGLIGAAVYAHASLEHPNTAYHLAALAIDVLRAPITISSNRRR